MWQGFPVLQFGTTDKSRKFHPFGLAVCSHETAVDFEFVFTSLKIALQNIFRSQFAPKYLVSDAAKSIHNGFKNAFGHSTIVMCYFHMSKAVKNVLPVHLSGETRQIFENDLYELHLASSNEIFDAASQLFVAKWKKKSSHLMVYFEKEWLFQNRNWYEGFAIQVPSTNNAIESFNRVLKDEQTLRERMDLTVFKVKMCEVVQHWSIEYETGLNQINHVEPPIDLPMWTEAYKWAKSNIDVKSFRDQTRITYCEDNNTEVPSTWEDFENYRVYMQNRFRVSATLENETNWKNWTCVCCEFFKKYICRHIIGVAIRCKLTKPPVESKTIPLGAKRKRGRPRKAIRALQFQPEE